MSDWDDPRLSALYRRAPKAGPDAHSDERIRAAARLAVGRQRRGRRMTAWALAATLVLGVGIGWQLLVAPPALRQPMSVPAGDAAGYAASEHDAAEPARAAAGAARVPPVSPVSKGQADNLTRDRSPAYEQVQDDFMRRRREPAATMSGPATAPPSCEGHWLPDSASRAAWQAEIERLRARGQTQLADCLQRRYRQLFDAEGR